MLLRRTLSDGANHNSVAASVCKLLVVLVVPTQCERNIAKGMCLARKARDREVFI